MKMLSIKLKTTTAIYCPYCHSPLVEHKKPMAKEDLIAHNEFYEVKCKSCGAVGYIHEAWPLPKEDTLMSELKPCQPSIKNAITVLENEKQCVLRQIQIGGCDRNCVKCDLVMKDSEILEGYDTAIAVLRRAQPDEPPVRCAECANYQTQNCGAKMDKDDEI